MRKFLPLLLCLSLSIFTVARATKLTAATTQKADAKAFSPHTNSVEEQDSDDDQNAEGDDNDENASDADDADGQDPGNDDVNDNGADDDPGDGGDDGGGK